MNNAETELRALRAQLTLSEKRFEIALGFSELTMFEYNVLTKEIKTQHDDFEIFGMPPMLAHGVEDVISSVIIAPRSHDAIRALYAEIDDGAPAATTVVYALDRTGAERVVKLHLVNIFNEQGLPVYAVGVRKDITDLLHLKNEVQYGSAAFAEWHFAYEANITQDKLLRCNPAWLEEMQLPTGLSFTEMVSTVLRTAVAPEFSDYLRRTLSRENLISAFEHGQTVVNLECRKKLKQQDYTWFRQSINIIREELTGDIDIRCYLKNINEEKQREKNATEERYYYEALLPITGELYEFNLTTDCIVKRPPSSRRFACLGASDRYSDLITDICENAIHPHERELFRSTYLRENLLAANAQGKRELSCEYRSTNSHGEFVWMRSTLRLFQDASGGDVKGCSYSQLIDVEKREQLDLLYKSQRDSLTGLYNKAALEEKITEFLAADAAGAQHAFLILDLDAFKQINDNFGHAFGDMLLSQMASRLASLFHEEDILGRVGGDEFVMFMKNIGSIATVRHKAAELCARLTENYTQHDIVYRVSVSIGIAFYGAHGTTYDALYRNSDTALYYAKEHGRSRYAIYENTMHFGATTVKEIDNRSLYGRTFRENISEYVFRILYEAVNKELAIHTILELLGKHFHTDRAYIFENSADGQFTTNTFEWCAPAVSPQIENLQQLPSSTLGDYAANFNHDGYFYMPNIRTASPTLRAVFAPQGIQSMLQFSIVSGGKFVGFIGFDQCDRLRIPTQTELDEARNMTNVLGVFLTEMRAIQAATLARRQSEISQQMALSVVNGLASYAYVCDTETHKLLFINDTLHALVPEAKVGDVCYRAFWSQGAPCAYCPIKMLGSGDKFTTEMFNHNLKIWVSVTVSLIDWLDGKQACLVDSMDITKYIAAAP